MKKNSLKTILIALAITFAIMALFVYISAVLPLWNGNFPTEGTRAGTGDYTTGITAPLLSVAGFLMLYLAFVQQRDAASANQKTLAIQQFENNFFALINIHRKQAHEVNNQAQGISFFEHYHKKLKPKIDKPDTTNLRSSILKHDEEFEQDWGSSHTNQYMKSLLFMIQFVEKNVREIHSDEAKEAIDQYIKHYFNLLQSQLTDYELSFIFYQFLTADDDGAKHLKKRLQKYSFFNDFYHSKYLIRPVHKDKFIV